MADLESQLDEISRTPVLLLATDFDGTLAPIVDNPELAEADRAALVALRMLHQLPQTHVALISGRALGDLSGRVKDAGEIHLVGSHGSEFEATYAAPIPDAAKRLLKEVISFAEEIAARFPGARVERKPTSLAFHYRNVQPELISQVVDEVLVRVSAWPGVHVRHGKMVIELSVLPTDKGSALKRLRQRVGATGAVFIGDDVTDEDAFTVLSGPDVAIKVGHGPSVAHHRVGGTVEVVQVLARLAEKRAVWLAGEDAVPIDQHSLLSDQRTVALVSPTARVSWFCVPRIDSPAIFAELLGGPTAGYFEIRPTGELAKPIGQSYEGDSFVLTTKWPGFSVVDYLDAAGGRAFQRAGRTDLLRVIEGRGRAVVTFAPRLDFGRVHTRLAFFPDGLVVEGAIDPMVLHAPGIQWEIADEGPHQTARAVIELTGEPVVLDFRYGTANLERSLKSERSRRDQNLRFWQGWAGMLSVPSLAADMTRRSALVLKALTYGPTGAIAAAATTSLPEAAGGIRNWDYRYCWPRDSAMAAHALVRLGVSGPAMKLLDWLLGIFEHCEPGSLIRPIYTVTGGHLSAEGEIPQLAGYRGSRPVRVGNAASQQIQLDVFGPIADLIAALAHEGVPLTPDHGRLMEMMAGAVVKHWREPDHGIWELRSFRRHHVYSKVMCWVMLDRAISICKYMGRPRLEWATVRDEIAKDILEFGWNPTCDAFGSSYEDGSPDAASLWVGLSGLVGPEDLRFVNTVRYVERALCRGPCVYRYLFDDGLPGLEGGFNLCATWLIEAYAKIGRLDRAQKLLDDYLQLAGPTGLLAEECSPNNHHALGNFPQAYSHLGLINAVLAVAEKNGT